MLSILCDGTTDAFLMFEDLPDTRFAYKCEIKSVLFIELFFYF